MKKIVLILFLALPIASMAQTASHLKASEDFVAVMGLKESFGSVIDAMLKTQSQTLPEEHREKFAEVMRTFMNKYFNYETLKPAFAKLYAAEFNEAELKELTKFYSGEVGKKFAAKSPKLMESGMMIGQNIVKDHKDELQQMIKEAFEKP